MLRLTYVVAVLLFGCFQAHAQNNIPAYPYPEKPKAPGETTTKSSDIQMISTVAEVQGLNFTYYSIPLHQQPAWDLKGVVYNPATYTQTGVRVSANIVDDGSTVVYNEISTAGTIVPNSIDSISPGNVFFPSSAGTFTVTCSVNSDSFDTNPNNNSDVISLVVSDSVYQRDDGNRSGPGLSNGSFSYERGNLFETKTRDKAVSISFRVDENTDPGAYVYALLYEDDQGFPIPIEWSDDHEIVPQEIGNWVTLRFNSPIDLVAGQNYYAMVGSYGGYEQLVISDAQNAPPISSFFVDDFQTFYYTNEVSMVRLNLLHDVGQNEFSLKLPTASVFPNPAGESVMLDLSETVELAGPIVISDMLGRIVHRQEAAGTLLERTSIETGALPPQVYMVTIPTVEGQITTRLIRQ